MDYIEHFGEGSGNYRLFRPNYPEELFDYLLTLVSARDLAWDCATGNGQAAVALAKHFKQVFATDINPSQLEEAVKKANIYYHCCPADKTEIKDKSVDLITVAQALHWFPLADFYQEVLRVLKPKGIIAAWCYSLGSISSKIDIFLHKLYDEILRDTWPIQRRDIDNGYRQIHFPFHRLSPPKFIIKKELYFADFIGYLQTWSAVKEYEKRYKNNPINLVYSDLKREWGEANTLHTMVWPLHLLVGKIEY